MTPIALHIVTALNCEAKPLIDFYRLKKVTGSYFDYYKGRKQGAQDCEIKLLVSGLGCPNMATACGWLAAQSNNNPMVWLNVGTAGHKTRRVGALVRVSRAVDVMSGRNQYPALTAKWAGLSSALLTYQSPCADYPADVLVDMEGSAFFRSAGHFTSTELVQSVKVVSDNEEESVERLNASLISQLIAPHVNEIDTFANQLLTLLPNYHPFQNEHSLIAHLHSTVSQQQQYSELVSKLQSLQSFDPGMVEHSTSMQVLITQLTEKLNAIQPTLQQMVSQGG